MSSHYETKKPLSPELIKKLIDRFLGVISYIYWTIVTIFAAVM